MSQSDVRWKPPRPLPDTRAPRASTAPRSRDGITPNARPTCNYRRSSRGCAHLSSKAWAGRFDHVVTALLDADLHRSLLSRSLRSRSGIQSARVEGASSPEHVSWRCRSQSRRPCHQRHVYLCQVASEGPGFGPSSKLTLSPVEIEGCVNPVVSGDYP